MTDDERKKHNKRVLERWKRGENMSTSTVQDSWFPDRSKGAIKKDADAVKFLYGEDAEAIDDKKVLKLIKKAEEV